MTTIIGFSVRKAISTCTFGLALALPLVTVACGSNGSESGQGEEDLTLDGGAKRSDGGWSTYPDASDGGSQRDGAACSRVATLTNIAYATGPRAGEFTDVATLSGAVNPTGTVTFQLFRAGDMTCSEPPIFVSVKQVTPSKLTVTSDPTNLQEGAYQFVASYGGDPKNAAAATPCSESNARIGFGSR